MSHPNKKRSEDRRTERHMLLLTEAEMKRYRDKANAAGVSVNEWIRGRIVAAASLDDLMSGAWNVEDPTTS